ncbi:MAG: hypothetical protein HUK22_01955, partial [Thermoguttaceae bacterium]|nr:hypothetical protein [Thermoguttaceae bacterium]
AKGLETPDAAFAELPPNFRLRAEWRFDPAKRDAARPIELTVGEKRLVVDPGTRKVGLGDFWLEKVDFSAETIRLDVVVFGDLIDVCVNDDRAVIDVISETPAREATVKTPPEYETAAFEIAPIL